MSDMSTVKVEGAQRVQNNLERQIDRKLHDITAGLQVAADFAMGEAKELTPVDSGNLRATAATSLIDDSNVSVFYTADYAAKVHESNMSWKGRTRQHGSGKGNYWDSGENKFLEKAINRNVSKITKLIVKYAKVKK